MKYLKLYEYTNSYEEILIDEYDSYSRIPFLEKQSFYIRDFIKNLNKGYIVDWNYYQILKFSRTYKTLYIYKLEDDYYLLCVKNFYKKVTFNYFKCDQLSGLKKCLLDKS